MNPETEKCEKSKDAEQIDALGEAVAKNLVVALQPMQDAMVSLGEVVTAQAATLSTLAEKVAAIPALVEGDAIQSSTGTEEATGAAAKLEAEKAAAAVVPSDSFTVLNDTLSALTAGLLDVTKTAEETKAETAALKKSTPAATTRDEKVEAEKAADTNPNSCFDSAWPFLAGN